MLRKKLKSEFNFCSSLHSECNKGFTQNTMICYPSDLVMLRSKVSHLFFVSPCPALTISLVRNEAQ